MENTVDGIFLVDKAAGESSYGVVRKVKRLLNVRKVGHAGTLDPFATGLLIVLLGQGTRLSDYVMSESKVYEGVIRLGIETDSFDSTGRVIRTSDVPDLKKEIIEEKANAFVGVIDQVPPAFSALRYKGTRAYKLARKGIKVELKKRKVTINFFDVISVNLPCISFKIRCSSGTYIRTVASDLGKVLGPGAHLRSLRRLASGSFDVKDAFDSREILSKSDRLDLVSRVIPLRHSLPDLYNVTVSDVMAGKIRNGCQPVWDELAPALTRLGDRLYTSSKPCNLKLINGDDLVAVLQIREEASIHNIKVRKVFHKTSMVRSN
jgi:tRNA pseudouridine55 synthase